MGTQIEKTEGNRGFQDAVSYAVGHRTRVEIIAALHDLGTASAIELSRVVHQPLSSVTHHLTELLKSGSLIIDRTERVKSVNQHFYAVVNPIFLNDEEMQALPEEERQEVCRVILQSVTAEALAAFWTGDLPSDPRLFLCWNWFNVDEKGRADIADEQVRFWRRAREIEAEATERCTESEEEPFSLIVTGLSFKRWRNAKKRVNEHEVW
jgi:DNA-binding transcriptional ArsR family regulator